MSKIIAAMVLLSISIGVNAMFPPPSGEKLRAITETESYKKEKAEWFAEQARWVNEREKKETR
jgi:hypothetical protein